jgi:hypothetical protein
LIGIARKYDGKKEDTHKDKYGERIFKIYSKEKAGIIPKLKIKRGKHGELFATVLHH